MSSGAGGGAAATLTVVPSRPICRYYTRGICRFGDLCRFSHDIVDSAVSNLGESVSESEIIAHDTDSIKHALTTKAATTTTELPSSNPSTSNINKNWANAPVFVPKGYFCVDGTVTVAPILSSTNDITNKSWAEVAAAGGSSTTTATSVVAAAATSSNCSIVIGGLCPYESNCPYGDSCPYSHIELCEMCDTYCLHPTDMNQRRKHIQECLQQHERDMELSFAIARSKDKTCGICFDTIMEKSGREKRFGILPSCCHTFCLECIRKWRQAKQFEHKITRSCPECRVSSDFVCPSAFWVDTKEEKDKLLSDYRSALGAKDCKYFNKGDGKCPFGNKCFYKHALPSGKLVDVGNPKRARKLHRNTDELIDLLDIYLWDFVDQRDYDWLELLSNPTDTEDSDWSED